MKGYNEERSVYANYIQISQKTYRKVNEGLLYRTDKYEVQ